jgi:hypothetical protein
MMSPAAWLSRSGRRTALRLMYFWMGRASESKGQMPEAISALEKSWHGSAESLQGRGFGMLASVC